jgi:2-dehydro-3-deoxyphosphogluconate aldolase/(4S)-4-hydroxy-2-oxoglutarate aldolase
MKKVEVCEVIRNVGVVPAIRVASAEDAHFACEVVASGGIPIVEVTMTVPEAVDLIAHLISHHTKIVVGAGTVLNTEMAGRCIDAGAHFLTSPGLNLKVVEFAAKRDIATLPGAMTPTEVMEAWDAGSDFVKVFPCVDIGGARYIKALKTSLPQVPLIAAGGVTQQTATAFLLAGATAIGVGTELVPADAIANREAERIRELAHRFLGYVKDARSRMAPQNDNSAPGKTDFLSFHHRIKSNKR